MERKTPRSGWGRRGGRATATKSAIGIVRVDDDLRDLLAIAQSEVPPGLAGVGGFVDAVAHGEIGALKAFAAADVDDVRIGRGDGDGADGAGGLAVEDGMPGAAEIVGLPDAAVVDADVEDIRLTGDTGAPTVRPPRKGPIMRHSSPE